MWDKIWSELKRADSYQRDWYGFVCNQSAHFAVVGVGAGLLFPSPWCLIALAVGYFGIWERFIQGGNDLSDSLADTLNVLCGAAIIIFPDLAPSIFSVWALFLVLGVLRRV